MKNFKYLRTTLMVNFVKATAVCLLFGLVANAGIYADQQVGAKNQNMDQATGQTADRIPQQCSTNCETSYGMVLGESPAGIPAYSNCNSECVIFEPYHLNDIYTGIKWQCVEYARRWLLHEHDVVFGDVDIAADIWAMPEVTNPITKQTFKFDSIVNGASSLPQRGDLLIYGEDYLGTGHVAVVITVDEKQQAIHVAEQNYANTLWADKHARKISYTTQKDRVWLLDSYLVGWKRAVLSQH